MMTTAIKCLVDDSDRI